MIYIYKITNRKTGSVYIGKTNNFNRRMREHKSKAFNPNSSDYDSLLYKKIREYGWDNFNKEIIEETDEKMWREREIYWIEHFNSFKGRGYNLSVGGDGVDLGEESLTHKFHSQIKNDILYTELTFNEIASKYNFSISVVSNINNGLVEWEEDLAYPLRPYGLGDEKLIKLKELLENSTLSMADIALKLGMSYSTVKKINSGKINHSHIFKSYPVRKWTPHQIKAMKVIELHETTDLSYSEIGEIVGLTKGAVGKIARGEVHKNLPRNK